MIMTKDKARELRKMTTGRMASVEMVPEAGTYAMTITQDADEVRRAASEGECDYVLMGTMVPAHKAASFSELMQDETGMMPSTVLLVKRVGGEPSSASRLSAMPSSRMMTVEKSGTHTAAAIVAKGIELIPGRHEVKVNGKQVVLTFSEFRILQTIMGKPGWVFSRDQIIHAVHGDNYSCTERAVDVQVTGLRKKMGAAGKYVETVRGVGYRFTE